MRKFERAEEPAFLAESWEEWGLEWERRYNEQRGGRFVWRVVEGEPVNQKLMPLLMRQTQDHCSFCDNIPRPSSIDTIEHFRPKARFPRDAYRWANLYYCCMGCQQKGHDFDELALQPDAVDYEFDRYFRWDYTRGTIEVNEHASEADQKRAEATIKLYRMNEKHPTFRKIHLARRANCPDEPIDLWPYRHYLGE